jgi:hypothetical protein
MAAADAAVADMTATVLPMTECLRIRAMRLEIHIIVAESARAVAKPSQPVDLVALSRLRAESGLLICRKAIASVGDLDLCSLPGPGTPPDPRSVW